METTAEQFWENKHQGYASKKFVAKPNWLAVQLLENLGGPARILDLGCGQGQDSMYFASNGHNVVAADFSGYALSRFSAQASSVGIRQVRLDLSGLPYPFDSGEFDVVYAHLSLHYFPEEITTAIFSEVARLLDLGGQFWALFNSEHDPEASNAAYLVLEERYLQVAPGDRKRYFTTQELPHILGPNFVIDLARYGRGTTKSDDDQYVELVAHVATAEEEL